MEALPIDVAPTASTAALAATEEEGEEEDEEERTVGGLLLEITKWNRSFAVSETFVWFIYHM